MTDSPQRRHFTRIPFDTQYQLHTPDQAQQWQGEVADLSLHGALIKCPDNFSAQPGDKLLLNLILGQDDVSIGMEVHVVHLHDDLIGLECEHIDVESMTHLRKVLELNLGDPNLMEREIPEMLEVYK